MESEVNVKKIMEYLKGKKTYLTAIVIGIVAAAQQLGYEVPPGVLEILAALGLISLRAGMKKSEK